MQVLQLGTPLAPPNCCFICQQYWGEESKTHMIDTLREFEPAAITPLTGRKYVCEHCAKEMADLLDYVPKSVYNVLYENYNDAMDKLEFYEERDNDLKALQDIANRIHGLSDVS